MHRLRMTLLALTMLVQLVCIYSKEYGTPIKGLYSEYKVKDEFIVVLKNSRVDTAEKVGKLTEYLHQKSPKATVQKYFVIADLVAVWLSIPETDLETIASHRDIQYIQANHRTKFITQGAVACASQATGEEIWGLSRISHREPPDYSTAAYSHSPMGGDGVEVYVVDTGVYVAHTEFEGRATHGFTVSSNAAEGDMDLNGHGTHVAGTIGGRTFGVAKKAKIIAVKVLDKDGVGSVVDLLEGFQWVYNDFTMKKAKNGGKAKAVVNLSLGGQPYSIDVLDEAAITMATQAGLPFVVASGNDDVDACVVSPGRSHDVVNVGATRKDDSISSYSNHGPCVDILAPGDAIKSAYVGSPSAAAFASGTSMAAPHIAGAVAVYLSEQCLMKSPEIIKAWLKDSATKGRIAITGSPATPNNLLYISCTQETCACSSLVTSAVYSAEAASAMYWDDDHYWLLLIPVLTSVVLGVIIIIFLLSIHGRMKAIDNDLQRCLSRSYMEMCKEVMTKVYGSTFNTNTERQHLIS